MSVERDLAVEGHRSIQPLTLGQGQGADVRPGVPRHRLVRDYGQCLDFSETTSGDEAGAAFSTASPIHSDSHLGS